MAFAYSRLVELLLGSGWFDGEWYRRTYRDVDMLGMDPVEHYMAHGFRMNLDPGPDFCSEFMRVAYALGEDQEPVTRLALLSLRSGEAVLPRRNRVLYAAARAARLHGYNRAIRLAEMNMPEDIAHTVLPLRASAAAAIGDTGAWCAQFNSYLRHFEIAPIELKGEGTIFHRLSCAALPEIRGGPLVSVIMPAWNAEVTVRKAAESILAQTWRNIELFIIDDASTDGTWTILQEIAARDQRVRIMRNKVNVGPYVSKNIALLLAKGEWITGQDADDWAHPQRIERHLTETLATGSDATLTHWIRMKPDGQFLQFRPVSPFSFDGVVRIAAISCLFNADVLRSRLGFWDSVRFGADTEMIERAEKVLGDRFCTFRQFGMIGLDIETSLTNHPVFGLGESSISPIRQNYLNSFGDWHARELQPSTAFLPFLQRIRRFEAPDAMVVPVDDIERNLSNETGK